MRKIFLFMMVSLDGYFEGPNHDLSWHNVDQEFNTEHAIPMLKSVDTLLFGHRTYDMMASYWSKEDALQDDPEVARYMNDLPKIVVTHTPFTPEWQKSSVLSGDVAAEIRKLKEMPGKDIALLGSNNLCVSLMEHGLVEEFRIMINPVAASAGTPLFAGIKSLVKFKRLKTREFKNGNVLQVYSK